MAGPSLQRARPLQTHSAAASRGWRIGGGRFWGVLEKTNSALVDHRAPRKPPRSQGSGLVSGFPRKFSHGPNPNPPSFKATGPWHGIQTDQRLLTYSCAHLAHRYAIAREDKLCGDQAHSGETQNEPLLGSNLPAQRGPCMRLIFPAGLLQKAPLSPAGPWVTPGTCPHLQLGFGLLPSNQNPISHRHGQAAFPGE